MEDLTFHLEGIVKDKNEVQDFQGPLSLILMLLSKNKIEIRDIKISEILDQYLEYLAEMERMDLEIASEFVQMASHLLYIKTRTLLAGEEEQVSELEELISSLEQLKSRDTFAAVQKIVPELKRASETGLLYYSKLPEPLPKISREYEYRHDPADLFRALYAVASRGILPSDEITEVIAPSRIVYEVRSKSRELIMLLREKDEKLEALYSRCRSRSEIVATFISMLELCSMGSIVIDGEEGDYTLRFVGGSIEEILERIVE